MAADDMYDDRAATRARQASPQAVAANHARMSEWGAYNLMKVRTLDEDATPDRPATGYITVLPAISGRTPEEMVKVLGLRTGVDLVTGAAIYQLEDVPGTTDFEVRGYTTLPDGLRLRQGGRDGSGRLRARARCMAGRADQGVPGPAVRGRASRQDLRSAPSPARGGDVRTQVGAVRQVCPARA